MSIKHQADVLLDVTVYFADTVTGAVATLQTNTASGTTWSNSATAVSTSTSSEAVTCSVSVSGLANTTRCRISVTGMVNGVSKTQTSAVRVIDAAVSSRSTVAAIRTDMERSDGLLFYANENAGNAFDATQTILSRQDDAADQAAEDATNLYQAIQSIPGLSVAAIKADSTLGGIAGNAAIAAAFATRNTDGTKSIAEQVVDRSPSVAGPGASPATLHFEDEAGNPIANADVWVTTDAAGTNTIAGTLQTDSQGDVRFRLDKFGVDGTTLITYFAWYDRSGSRGAVGPIDVTCD